MLFRSMGSLIIRINRFIDRAAKSAGLTFKVTTYTARRCWSTFASTKELSIPLEVIDKALGHGTKKLIFRYVKYDESRIDDANQAVAQFITEGS